MSAFIIVGTDGSPHAEQAVLWAAGDAARRDLPLRVVHVVDDRMHEVSLRSMPGVTDSAVDDGNRILAEAEELALRHRPGLTLATVLVRAGSPSEGLREQVTDALEIVVGHRGLGGFAGLVLGSTGLHLAGRLPVPVVVVRGDHSHDDDQGRYREIIAGVDLGQDAAPVLEYAFAAADARRARLRVVHAWQPAPAVLDQGYVVDMEQVEANYRNHLGTVVAPWLDDHPDTDVVEDLIFDHPVRALAEAAHKADLLIVGHHGGAVPRLGSVGHGAIHHATCPVAVVPPP